MRWLPTKNSKSSRINEIHGPKGYYSIICLIERIVHPWPGPTSGRTHSSRDNSATKTPDIAFRRSTARLRHRRAIGRYTSAPFRSKQGRHPHLASKRQRISIAAKKKRKKKVSILRLTKLKLLGFGRWNWFSILRGLDFSYPCCFSELRRITPEQFGPQHFLYNYPAPRLPDLGAGGNSEAKCM